jgi:hypothetical protein
MHVKYHSNLHTGHSLHAPLSFYMRPHFFFYLIIAIRSVLEDRVVHGVGKVSHGLLDSSTKWATQVNERLRQLATTQRLTSTGWLWPVG